MKNNLYEISNEEYLEKVNDDVIDCEYKQFDRFAINKFLKSKIWKPRGDFDYPLDYRIYDHIHKLRLPTLNGEYPKSIGGAFTSPYIDAESDVESISNLVKEHCVDQNYKIYLVNPKLYRYHASGTVSLAHIKYLDKRYFEGKTDYCVSCINDYMIKEIGEPLFYLI